VNQDRKKVAGRNCSVLLTSQGDDKTKFDTTVSRESLDRKRLLEYSCIDVTNSFPATNVISRLQPSICTFSEPCFVIHTGCPG
jgi:hypothetical protein